MRTFTRHIGLAAAAGAMTLLLACGSGSGSGGNGNDIVVDNADEIGSACAAIGEEAVVDLCADYDQPSVPVTANGNSVELYNSPGAGDSVNCFQGDCTTMVQAGDEFTAICTQDGYVGVILQEQFRYQDDYYVAGTNYWSSGAVDGNDRLTPIVFIPDFGLQDSDELDNALAAAYEDIFGDEFQGDRCDDPRAAVETNEMEEFFTGQDAA